VTRLVFQVFLRAGLLRSQFQRKQSVLFQTVGQRPVGERLQERRVGHVQGNRVHKRYKHTDVDEENDSRQLVQHVVSIHRVRVVRGHSRRP